MDKNECKTTHLYVLCLIYLIHAIYVSEQNKLSLPLRSAFTQLTLFTISNFFLKPDINFSLSSDNYFHL